MWKLVSKLINVRACSNPRGISPFTFYIWNGGGGKARRNDAFSCRSINFSTSRNIPLQLEKHIYSLQLA